MNNDNNSTSSVAGCSSITTTATNNTNAAGGKSNDKNAHSSAILGHLATTLSTTSPSIYTSANVTLKSAPVFSTGVKEERARRPETWEENRLKDCDDCQFKHLLEEAYSYKNPRDKANKSELFLQLLQKAENETDDPSRTLESYYQNSSRKSNSNKQGGSLQDLSEAIRSESLDCDYNCGVQRYRRHNHNSRPKKNSSVSSRQREGGSLPSNVNVSNCCLSVCEQPYMNDEKTKQQRRGKTEPRILTITTAAVALSRPTLGSTGTADIAASGSSIVTTTATSTLCRNPELSLATNVRLANKNDFAVVNTCGSSCEGSAGAVSLAATIGSTSTSRNALSSTSDVVISDNGDTVIEMNENFIDTHSELVAQKQFDENGNSLNTTYTTSQPLAKAKKKKHQSERNTTQLNLEEVEGYRGSDPIEELLKYIESSEDPKQNNKVSKIAENKKKDRKKDKDNKDKEKDKGKVKRSNSLEELRTCTKLEADDVTMRTKVSTKNKNIDVKDKQAAAPAIGNTASAGSNRKGERRSWGTEELTYLGENNAIEEVRDKVKEKEKKKSKEKNKEKDNKETNDKNEKNIEKRKKSETNSILSMESISYETAEFYVVTKKRKPKKQKPVMEEGRNSTSTRSHKNHGFAYQTRKFQLNFTGDRDNLINNFNKNNNNDKSRRKSTSSMPPSDKSDSSDLDSVHSLPIDAAGGRSPGQDQHHLNQPRSYADIARKTEINNKTLSPSAASGDVLSSTTASNDSSNTELETSSSATSATQTIITSKKARKTVKADFPDLISNDVSTTGNSSAGVPKQISYSQSLTTAAGKLEEFTQEISPPRSNHIPNEPIKIVDKQHLHQQVILQKSKSVENDNFYNNIEHYPALEKTIKRYSTSNSSAPLETNPLANATIPTVAFNQGNSINNPACSGAPVNKKSKIINTKANEEVLMDHQQQHQHQISTKKSKREKSGEIFTSTQSATSTASSLSSNINIKNQLNHNHHINNSNNINKSSGSHSRNINININNSNNSSGNKLSNRPAVIILNDDTSPGGPASSIGNEFTFGDFNEEELKLFNDTQPASPNQQTLNVSLYQDVHQKRRHHTTVTSTIASGQNFDDSGGTFNSTTNSTMSDVVNNSDDVGLLINNVSVSDASFVVDESPDSGICNNFSESGPKVKRISSTNISKNSTTSHSSVDVAISNSIVNSSASTSPSKESSSSASSTSSSTFIENISVPPKSTTTIIPPLNSGKSSKQLQHQPHQQLNTQSTPLSTIQYNQAQNVQPQTQMDNGKSKQIPNLLYNTRYSAPNKRSSHPKYPQQQNDINNFTTTTPLPSQQLETCGDIESAIIAAAKKAAAAAAEQNSSSAVSNRKQPTISSTSTSPAMASGSTRQNFLNNNSTSSTNSHIYDNYSTRNDTESPPMVAFCATNKNNNKNHSSRKLGGEGKQPRDMDVYYIPPMSATPTPTMHTETIVNFIGSAWEEVSNSKVTLFYDGQ